MRRRRATILALDGDVGGNAGLAGRASLLGEVVEESAGGAEVDLVGRLAAEGRVRHDGVVLVDVEGDEIANSGEAIKLVQVEPVVLQGAPPGLDHGVGGVDIELGEDAAQGVSAEQGIDLVVHVLDAGVSDDCSGRSLGRQVLGGLGEDRAGGAGLESRGDVPGEDSAADVVDDRVDERRASRR